MVEPPKADSKNFDDLEEFYLKEQSRIGYQSGLQIGEEQGYEVGYSQGAVEGTKCGSEVGFYKGFLLTWISILESRPTFTAKSIKILSELKKVLELVNHFPTSNETSCEVKLLDIRVKFKQTMLLLDIRLEESYSKN